MDQHLLISKEKIPLRQTPRRMAPRERCCFEYQITKPETTRIQETGDILRFSEKRIEKLPDFKDTGRKVAFFDKETLHFPLILRNVRPGDRFKPLGLGGTQKIKDYIIKQKLSRRERARCSVLLSNDTIIWVVGHRIDESVKVTGATRNILKAELFLA
jgi:tRNA(Ile)-lysidine synthase